MTSLDKFYDIKKCFYMKIYIIIIIFITIDKMEFILNNNKRNFREEINNAKNE